MDLTPNEILEHEFEIRFRGYDRDEVRAYLEEIASQLTALLKERNALKGHVATLRTQVDELKKRDEEVRIALTTAHSVSEELKRQSEKEAELIVERARLDAERIVADAHREAIVLEDRIRALRRLKRETVHRIRSHVEGYLRILDEETLPGEEIDSLLHLTATEARSLQDSPPVLEGPEKTQPSWMHGLPESGQERPDDEKDTPVTS